ncbi:MAG: HNH endonuclease family protein [Clostridia bacterium]|nr:HNH endonuclease family protein [Clostridia bacterium]
MIELFFDAYFQIFVQDKSYAVSAEDKISYEKVESLSKSYKHFVKKYCNDDLSILLNPLKEYAECFRQCFNPNICNGAVGSDYGIERMNVIIFGLKNTTVIPYLLYVFKNKSTQTEQNEICRVLETYIMRRMITHATTKNYNKLFTSLILNNVLDAQTLSARLKSGSDETSYIPNDSDVRDSFHKAKLYNLQTRGILYLLESGIHPKQSATALLGFNGYSLEHLMPKKWKNNWTGCQTDEQIEERNAIILTLGNLSIITQSLNASIRDSAWKIKKQGKNNKPGLIACASGIVTLQNALNTEQWNEEEIYKRADYLCDKAVLLWKT